MLLQFYSKKHFLFDGNFLYRLPYKGVFHANYLIVVIFPNITIQTDNPKMQEKNILPALFYLYRQDMLNPIKTDPKICFY